MVDAAFGDANVAMLASDVLVTDFSSILFDYANLDRPILFFLPSGHWTDEEVAAHLGDLGIVPGPVARTEDELWGLIDSVHAWSPRFQARLKAFRDAFCAGEDGRASKRVVDVVF